jgi:hypothetical protein
MLFLLGLFLSLGGAFGIAGAYFNWDWFMNMWGHINTTEVLGRGCARIFDAIVGLAAVVLGILMMLGVVEP